MLGLFGRKEFEYIANTKERGAFARGYEVYTRRPGFFTPYSCLSHFCGGLIAPVVYPVMNSLMGIGATLVAAAGLIGSMVLLLVSGGAFLFCASEMLDQCLALTKKCLTLFAAGILSIAIHSFMAVASVPHSLISLVTRSIATLISLCSEPQLDDHEEFDNVEFVSDAL